MATDDPMARLKQRIATASEGRSRPEITDHARAILQRCYGPRAPDIEDRFLKDLSTRYLTPTAFGLEMRAILAALDIPLIQALRDIDYWGDLRWGLSDPASVFDVLQEFLAATGLGNLELAEVQGRDTLILRIR